MKSEDVASNDGGGKRQGDAETAEADVGRLAGKVAGGARFIDFDGTLLLNSESPAALGGVSVGWRGASVEEGHHAGVIGAIEDQA
jgi:hypothetical protein